MKRPQSNGLFNAIAAALLLVGVSGNNAFAAAQEPQVRVNGEVLVGVDSPARGVSAFLGIPFAKPPIGALRWSAPVDYSGDGGGGEVCCWTNAIVKVTVTN